MLKILLLVTVFCSVSAFSQTTDKPNPDSLINAEEQVNSLPGGSVGGAYSVRTRKKSIKAPSAIAPIENQSPASCADSLGGKGSANFTACEAAKRTR